MSTMQPFLMFQGGHTEDAMNFNDALFDDGEVLDVTRWQKGEKGAEGSIKLARFRTAGQSVLASGVLMPLGDYGFSKCFVWGADRFGVSWQPNLP